MIPAPGLRAEGLAQLLTDADQHSFGGTAMVSSSSFRRLHLDVLEDRCLPSLFAPFTPYQAGTLPTSVAVGDFRHDGILDLAVANDGGANVSVLPGNGDGTFGKATNYAVGGIPIGIAVGDFRHDGILDLTVTNFGSGTVSVLLGNGDGTFQPAVNYTVGSEPISVAVGDFDGDGTLDLAVANDGSGNVSILLGNGDGTFGKATNYAAGTAPFSVAVGDFARNGILDLAVANRANPGTVSVLLGNGFGAPVSYAVGTDPTYVAVGDFKGNGTLDLAVANVGSGNVSILLGNGDGTFQSATNYPALFGANAIAVGDFNRDGTLDLAVADNTSLSVLLGNGDGTFQSAINYVTGGFPQWVAAGDFNRDGALDLAVASINGVDVFLNQEPVTSTTLTSNVNPTVAGQLATFTATVTQAVPGGPAPTGLVAFEDGGIVLSTGTLSASGTASFSTYSLATGDHAITAVYEGDSNFNGSTSPILNEVVNQDATTMALTVSASPALAGQPLELTATVQGTNPGFGPPTGNVLFQDGGVTIGIGALNDDAAFFTTTALAPGSHALTAVYVGDKNFTGSTAPAVSETINNPTPTISGPTPASLPEGSAGLTLSLTGSNFAPGATVQWNGVNLTVVASGVSQIQASVPASLLSEEGIALVTVTNPGPGGGVSLARTFTIADAGLTATRVNLNVHGNLNFSGTVATFTDANPNAILADFTAIIIWDDGTANYGTISGTGPFTVSGTHTFAPFHNLHIITVTILDVGGSQASVTDNVIDPTANEAYVMQLYQDLLGRQADSAGLAHWSGLLDRGASRAQVALAIEKSLEYRQDEVQALYVRYLYRNADPTGLATFANFLDHGGTLEQVAADIVGSPEYFQHRGGGTTPGFLIAIYHDALGRNIGPTGEASFGNQLVDGTTRRDIASAIFSSAEYRQNLVQGYYQSVLGRPAGRSGLAHFADALADGGRDEQVMADIFGSEEFFSKM
jgi:hypothetical protein